MAYADLYNILASQKIRYIDLASTTTSALRDTFGRRYSEVAPTSRQRFYDIAYMVIRDLRLHWHEESDETADHTEVVRDLRNTMTFEEYFLSELRVEGYDLGLFIKAVVVRGHRYPASEGLKAEAEHVTKEYFDSDRRNLAPLIAIATKLLAVEGLKERNAEDVAQLTKLRDRAHDLLMLIPPDPLTEAERAQVLPLAQRILDQRVGGTQFDVTKLDDAPNYFFLAVRTIIEARALTNQAEEIIARTYMHGGVLPT